MKKKQATRPDIAQQARATMQALAKAVEEARGLGDTEKAVRLAQNRMDVLFLLLTEAGLMKD